MKSYRHELWFQTAGRRELINITAQVEDGLRESGIREVVVAVTEGRLDLGPWEQIFYGEFDGKRRKRVLMKIVGE